MTERQIESWSGGEVIAEHFRGSKENFGSPNLTSPFDQLLWLYRFLQRLNLFNKFRPPSSMQRYVSPTLAADFESPKCSCQSLTDFFRAAGVGSTATIAFHNTKDSSRDMTV